MAELVFVVGGTRSGKSDYAQHRAERVAGRRCFIATGTAVDDEMRERIERHRANRDQRSWTTIEEPLDLGSVLVADPAYDVYLIDCLTLWISNLLLQDTLCESTAAERVLDRAVADLLAACDQRTAQIVLVSSEVGLGVVPENRLARLYRDLVGRCNRLIADRADEVVFVSCGLPLHLKKR